jgi:hypothetical protein
MPPRRLFGVSFSLTAEPLLCSISARRPSRRAREAANELMRLGVLAEPKLAARLDFPDAVAAGFGVTEYDRSGKAAQEIEGLWQWIVALTDT